MQIYDGSTSLSNKKVHLCASENNFIFKSKTNRIFIRYSLTKTDQQETIYFRMIYNPYFEGLCSNSSFKCSEGICINRKLVCDGRANCHNSHDESICPNFIPERGDFCIFYYKHCEIDYLNCLTIVQVWSDDEKIAYIHKISLISIGIMLFILVIVSIIISFKRSVHSHLKAAKVQKKCFFLLNFLTKT